MTFATIAIAHAQPPLPLASIELRQAIADDAPSIHALVNEHVESDHLLPRMLEDIERRIARFVVAARGPLLVGCAELAPLSPRTAEVRSMVVAAHARSLGIGQSIVAALVQQAHAGGFARLCAFTHRPAYFVRLGFSLVPHLWVREKITTDCVGCAAFRTCGQHAVLLDLNDPHVRMRADRHAAELVA